MENNNSTNNTSKFITAIIIIALALGIGWYVISRPSSATPSITTTDTTTTNNQAATPLPTSTSTTASNPKNKYKDGTYTAEGDYQVHIGPEHITVTLTLQNDIVTSATVLNNAIDRESVNYQNQFIGGYKQVVIGKNIDQINLSKVSGSSLTPLGFNNALAKIKTQATI